LNILVLGAGMMGRAIAYDLCNFSNFDKITIVDSNRKTLQSAEKFLAKEIVNFDALDINKKIDVKNIFQENDVVISAVPYRYNFLLAKIATETKTHFLDLGGNNDIVNKERNLFENAEEAGCIIIPDCGLAPGLTSVISKDIVEQMDYIDHLKIRVGGLPINPVPPLNYQIVFSPYGLINEYVEDAIILENGKIIKKKSMTEIEKIEFPKPFGKMEAFLTSGGCSTLPYTYKDKINYLDYKTIRYTGHCEKFKTLLDLGLAQEQAIIIKGNKISPRDLFVSVLLEKLPHNEKDVVLVKVIGDGIKNNKKHSFEYTIIDYYDEKNNITSMMRTTGYPVSITAQLIENGQIKKPGVFCSEEIVPCKPFFKELRKRNIEIGKEVKTI